jgi:hypothetical protein
MNIQYIYIRFARRTAPIKQRERGHHVNGVGNLRRADHMDHNCMSKPLRFFTITLLFE